MKVVVGANPVRRHRPQQPRWYDTQQRHAIGKEEHVGQASNGGGKFVGSVRRRHVVVARRVGSGEREEPREVRVLRARGHDPLHPEVQRVDSVSGRFAAGAAAVADFEREAAGAEAARAPGRRDEAPPDIAAGAAGVVGQRAAQIPRRAADRKRCAKRVVCVARPGGRPVAETHARTGGKERLGLG